MLMKLAEFSWGITHPKTDSGSHMSTCSVVSGSDSSQGQARDRVPVVFVEVLDLCPAEPQDQVEYNGDAM